MRYVVAMVNKFQFPHPPKEEEIVSFEYIPDLKNWNLSIINRFIANLPLPFSKYRTTFLLLDDVYLVKDKGLTLVYRIDDNNFVVLVDLEHRNCTDIKSSLRDKRINEYIN